MNSVYIGHGAPLNVLWKTNYRENLGRFAQSHDRPSAIVVVSAHFERHIPLQITSAEHPGIIYDYYGFPQEMYELDYNSPGDPKLAKEVAHLLEQADRSPVLNPKQGLDHGAWIPLKLMYPDADIPVIQLSIPIPRGPEELFKIGQIVAPLREKGVMFMGSGNLIHNLRHTMSQIANYGGGLDSFQTMPEEKWAVEVDQTLKEYLDEGNMADVLNISTTLPHFRAAAPTTEHFDPLYFVLGTMSTQEEVAYIHEGFEGGSISMRSFFAES